MVIRGWNGPLRSSCCALGWRDGKPEPGEVTGYAWGPDCSSLLFPPALGQVCSVLLLQVMSRRRVAGEGKMLQTAGAALVAGCRDPPAAQSPAPCKGDIIRVWFFGLTDLTPATNAERNLAAVSTL